MERSNFIRCWLVTLFLGLVTGPIAMAAQSASGPKIAGLQLGMTLGQFVARYPGAPLTIQERSGPCGGAKVVVAAQASWRAADSWLEVTFHRKGAEVRLDRFKHSSPSDFEPDDFEALRDDLVARFGPYSRLLFPAKMEPGGLIVGFEWAHLQGFSMTYRIHLDTHHGSNQRLATVFLTSRAAVAPPGDPNDVKAVSGHVGAKPCRN